MAQREASAPASGLRSMSEAPSLRDYLIDLWQRRSFMMSLATGNLRGRYLETTLGNLWHVLTPALLFVVYYIVFGKLLRLDRGLGDLFLPFLGIGVFTFQYAQRLVLSCGASIANNINLIRSLQFPRAVLPISTTIEQLSGYGFSIIVILGVVVLSGEPVAVSWLMAPLVIVLLTVFSLGVGLIVARLTDRVRDVANVIPFVFRLLFYLSGVIFALTAFVDQQAVNDLGVNASAETVRRLFTLNPYFTYIELLRDALLVDYEAEHPREAWLVASLYAPVSFVVGVLYFRGGEKSYGRG